MKRNTLCRVVIASSTVLLLSCDSGRVTAPVGSPIASTTPSHRPISFPSTPKPIACPSNESFATTAQVGPLGGLLSVGGIQVSIPVGALLGPVTMTLSVPASNYMEIDVSVEGVEHFDFELPIVVTVSYARCNANSLNFAPISAWYFDQVSGDLLEEMPSIDDKLLRTVTFTTGHLSGYILAN